MVDDCTGQFPAILVLATRHWPCDTLTRALRINLRMRVMRSCRDAWRYSHVVRNGLRSSIPRLLSARNRLLLIALFH